MNYAKCKWPFSEIIKFEFYNFEALKFRNLKFETWYLETSKFRNLELRNSKILKFRTMKFWNQNLYIMCVKYWNSGSKSLESWKLEIPKVEFFTE